MGENFIGPSRLLLARLGVQITDVAFDLGEDLPGRLMHEHVPGVLLDLDPADADEILDRLQPREEALRLEFPNVWFFARRTA